MNLKLAFCCTWGLGHLVPMVAIANRLKAAGNTPFFLVLNSPGQEPHLVLESGIELEYLLNKQPYDNTPERYLKDYKMLATETADICRSHGADILFCNSLFALANIAGDAAGLPVVKIFPNPYVATADGVCPFTQAEDEKRVSFDDRQFLHEQYLNLIRLQLGLPLISAPDLILSDFLNVVLTDSTVPNLKKNQADNVYVSGPIIEPLKRSKSVDNLSKWLHPQSKKVLVTLGTEVSRRSQAPLFFKKLIQTMSVYEDYFLQAVIFIGRALDKADFMPIPSSCFIIDDYFPQKEVIADVDLVISHGGWNTVHEAACFNKPQIVFPFEGHQFITADWIEAEGIGLKMNCENFELSELRTKITQVLSDDRIRQNVQEKSKYLTDSSRQDDLVDRIYHRYRERCSVQA